MRSIADIGYAAPIPIPSTVIPAMLAGQDVIGQSHTGSGKTAAFSLPGTKITDIPCFCKTSPIKGIIRIFNPFMKR